MVLKTKRMLLREMDRDDYQALFLVFGDPETMWHYPYTFDGQHVRDWIERNKNRYRKDGFGRRKNCINGRLAGSINILFREMTLMGTMGRSLIQGDSFLLQPLMITEKLSDISLSDIREKIMVVFSYKTAHLPEDSCYTLNRFGRKILKCHWRRPLWSLW